MPMATILPTAASAAGLTPFQAGVLGAVQGLTEFLPVSSSAHLYAVPHLLGWRYEGLAFDVALHGGTLLALLLAYGRDWWDLAREVFAPAPSVRDEARRMWLWLIVATIPGAIAGKLLEDIAETRLRALPLQALMLVVFGIVLWAVDRFRPEGREVRVPGWGAAAWMGLCQVLALVPGVSRSGITITGGRMAGLTRVSAARLSFMLATPITFGAVLLKVRHVPMDLPAGTLAVAVVTSALTGVLAIRGLIRWLGRAGFGAFLIYRTLFAALILFHVLRG